MSTQMMIEVMGYIGSALVLISFLMTSVVKLRLVNSIGGVISTVYSIIVRAYPIAVMNICLVIINFYFLYRMRKTEEKTYELIPTGSQDGFLKFTLQKYNDDILKCFPGITVDLEKANTAYIVCCDGVTAGILIGREKSSEMDIDIDYAAPAYRDCAVGKFLMGKLPKEGIKRLVYRGPDQNHKEYLSTLGFVHKDGAYVKDL